VDHLKPYLGVELGQEELVNQNEDQEQCDEGTENIEGPASEAEPPVTTRTGHIVKPRDILDL
jgi:hypothetical protein